MAGSLNVAFSDGIVTASVSLQLKQYDALLEFPADVVKHQLSDMTVVSTLEKQSFCEILLVKSKSQNNLLVMKRLDSENIRTTQDFLAGATDLATEVRFLSKLKHQNIIKIHGVSAVPFSESFGQKGSGYFFTMEYMGETLKERLQTWRCDLSCYASERERCHKLTTKKRQLEKLNLFDRLDTVALSIADAMEYLQDRGIALRDLTPSKIAYDDATGTVCLVDFSFARYLTSCQRDTAYRSAHYTAPEVREGEGYSLKSDVYSFGLILHEIASLKQEWRPKRSTDDEEQLSSRPSLENIPSEDIQCLIEDCWSTDPESRPSFEIIGMTLSAMISATRKKESLKELRRPMVLKQAVCVSGSESHSTLSTVDSLFEDDGDEEDDDFGKLMDELTLLEC